MNYKINSDEKAKLYGLPHFYQLVYLLGIRPYMDFGTGIVGIKRGISYQSLSEELYVEAHPGIKAFKPSTQQMRRAVEGLIVRGLLERISEGKRLILKCVLASADYSVQNKADSKPTGQVDRSQRKNLSANKGFSQVVAFKPDSDLPPKADTPPESGNFIILLREKFEKFWELYPNKKSKEKAWQVFQELNPDEALTIKIRMALIEQTDFHEHQRQQGYWMPAWKYPANWLTEKCWLDETPKYSLKEKRHAVTQSNPQRRSIDPLWESCKPTEDECIVASNILKFSDFSKAPPIG